MKQRLLLALVASVALAGFTTAASAITVNFTNTESPGVTCCGLMASNAYSAFGLTVDGAYWYADGRDTFDQQGISVFTSPVTITFAAVSAAIDFQYFVIVGFSGLYQAFDSAMVSLGSFVVNATGGANLLGTHSFTGGVKFLRFSGTQGFVQVSGVTFDRDGVALPEPGTLALLGLGLLGLGFARRRKSN